MNFWQSIGSPKYIVAPMVDQSELSWRQLSRKYGAQLCYTPMYHARLFVEQETYRQQFTTNEMDRPLIVQFCGNDPDILLQAAKLVEDKCDAVDLNLGCPQNIARRGHYGSFLQDEWPLIESIVSKLSKNLTIPVTCKIRVFDSIQKTIDYAKMIEKAGCSMLTVHGRTREQRGTVTGLADWNSIKAVKDAVQIPVIANGNLLYFEDLEKCLKATGCDGVMSAEGNLCNPALFVPNLYASWKLGKEYLEAVEETEGTHLGMIKSHMFKLLHSVLSIHTDLRDQLGRMRDIDQVKDILQTLETLYPESEFKQEVDVVDGIKSLPPWVAQPKIRPPPPNPKKRKLETEE